GGRGLPGDATVTIGSLNLHCGLTARGRPFDVAAAIARLPADIIALQETWHPHPAPDSSEAAGNPNGPADTRPTAGSTAARKPAPARGGAAEDSAAAASAFTPEDGAAAAPG